MLRVRDVMTTYPMTIEQSDAAVAAREAMQSARVHHIPVVDGQGRLVGVLSHRDLLQAMVYAVSAHREEGDEHPLEAVSIAEVMHREVRTITPQQPLRDAVEVMLREQIGCLPVVSGKEPTTLLGIVTMTDMLHVLERLLSREEDAERAEEGPPQA